MRGASAGRTAPAAPAAPAMPTYLGMPPFPEAAATALADSQLRHNLAHATGTIRAKRARAVAELTDWPDLRAAARVEVRAGRSLVHAHGPLGPPWPHELILAPSLLRWLSSRRT